VVVDVAFKLLAASTGAATVGWRVDVTACTSATGIVHKEVNSPLKEKEFDWRR
jgi:hypothetical protein